jgi:DNA-binding transcriptional ArsR family regulator
MDPLSIKFAALADPTRRAILARLVLGETSVTELAEPFAMSMPAVSKHLKVLEHAGLVTRGRAAQWRPCKSNRRRSRKLMIGSRAIAASGRRGWIAWKPISPNCRRKKRPGFRSGNAGRQSASLKSDQEITHRSASHQFINHA